MIRGMSKEDIEHTYTEIRVAIEAIPLHKEDREALLAKMARKLSVWHMALGGEGFCC